MPRERRIRIAQGLERRNLRSLKRERAGEGHLKNECRDAEEDERHEEAELSSCPSSFSSVQADACSDRGSEPRPPYGSSSRSNSAMTSAPTPTEPRERYVVERSLEIEGRCHRPSIDPEDAKPPRVRKISPGRIVYTYSGDNATPTIVRRRCRPLMTADT